MTNQTINKNTFNKIFINKEDLLAQMISSLTRINIKEFKNNITSNINNPKNYKYIVTMKDNNTFKLINTKTNKIKKINLKKN